MNEVKEDLEAPAVESAELTGDDLGEVVGGNTLLADDPDDESLGRGSPSRVRPEHQRVIPKPKDKRPQGTKRRYLH